MHKWISEGGSGRQRKKRFKPPLYLTKHRVVFMYAKLSLVLAIHTRPKGLSDRHSGHMR